MLTSFTKLSAFTMSICAATVAINAYACTTVFWNNTGNEAKVVARSMDLYISDLPKIVVYPRGVQRSGEGGDNSLMWQSKYGNVVVTIFNSHAVSDGMNEHGLAVHLLYLSGTQYETPNSDTQKLSNLMWAQYILDNFKTVNEAITSVDKFQIIATELHGKTWPIHLTMEDRTGDSAIIEYIDGKMKIYHGPQYQVMTNEPAYSKQLANLKRYQPYGGKLPLPGDPDPLSRFVRATTFLKTLPPPKNTVESIAGVLSVMRTASVPFGAQDFSDNHTEDAWPTRWISMADVTNRIYYFNSTTTPNIIWLDLKKLNFSKDAPILEMDPTNARLNGEIAPQPKPAPTA